MKIKIYLPIYASAEFECDIDIEGKTKEEIFEEFLNNCEPNACLCHQCSNHICSDIEIDEKNINLDYFIDEAGL